MYKENKMDDRNKIVAFFVDRWNLLKTGFMNQPKLVTTAFVAGVVVGAIIW